MMPVMNPNKYVKAAATFEVIPVTCIPATGATDEDEPPPAVTGVPHDPQNVVPSLTAAPHLVQKVSRVCRTPI